MSDKRRIEYINELNLSIEDLKSQNAEMRRTIEQAKQMIKQQRLNQEFNDKFLKDNDLWEEYVSLRTMIKTKYEWNNLICGCMVQTSCQISLNRGGYWQASVGIDNLTLTRVKPPQIITGTITAGFNKQELY